MPELMRQTKAKYPLTIFKIAQEHLGIANCTMQHVKGNTATGEADEPANHCLWAENVCNVSKISQHMSNCMCPKFARSC